MLIVDTDTKSLNQNKLNFFILYIDLLRLKVAVSINEVTF